MDLLIKSLTVEISQRVVEIVTDTGAIGTDVKEEVRQARAQIISVALLETAEHLLSPWNNRSIASAQVIVHGRLVCVKAEHLRGHLAIHCAGIRIISMAQKFGRGFRVQRVDIIIGDLLDDVKQTP